MKKRIIKALNGLIVSPSTGIGMTTNAGGELQTNGYDADAATKALPKIIETGTGTDGFPEGEYQSTLLPELVVSGRKHYKPTGFQKFIHTKILNNYDDWYNRKDNLYNLYGDKLYNYIEAAQEGRDGAVEDDYIAQQEKAAQLAKEKAKFAAEVRAYRQSNGQLVPTDAEIDLLFRDKCAGEAYVHKGQEEAMPFMQLVNPMNALNPMASLGAISGSMLGSTVGGNIGEWFAGDKGKQYGSIAGGIGGALTGGYMGGMASPWTVGNSGRIPEWDRPDPYYYSNEYATKVAQGLPEQTGVKIAPILVRDALSGEVIQNVQSGGFNEATEFGKEGQLVASNGRFKNGGWTFSTDDQYQITPEYLQEHYTYDPQIDAYVPKDAELRTLYGPIQRDTKIAAPWGGTQSARAGAYYVKDGDGVYLIDNDALNATYRRAGITVDKWFGNLMPDQVLDTRFAPKLNLKLSVDPTKLEQLKLNGEYEYWPGSPWMHDWESGGWIHNPYNTQTLPHEMTHTVPSAK